MFLNRLHQGSKWISSSSLTHVATYLLNLVDARIIDDKNVIQMARCVYTVEHCDSGSQAAIKIHECRACNFVSMCLHSYAQDSRIELILGFQGISSNLPNPKWGTSLPWYFPPLGVGVYQFAKLCITKCHLWFGSFSACFGGNMRLNVHSDNFHLLSLHALNPMEFQGNLISCKISGKPRKNGGTRYVVVLLSWSSVVQVEDAELFRNLGNRYPRNVFIGKW